MNFIFQKTIFFIILGMVFFLAACGLDSTTTEEQPDTGNVTVIAPTQITQENNIVESESSAYPGNEVNDAYPSGMPTREGLVQEPPNPDLNLPEVQGDLSVIGGVLVQEVLDEGFIPFDPYELILAEVVYRNEGEPAFITYDDESLRAETFPTGIFVFNNVPSGTYGLVINMAVNQFPIKAIDGTDLLITIEPGQSIDLGQLFVQVP